MHVHTPSPDMALAMCFPYLDSAFSMLLYGLLQQDRWCAWNTVQSSHKHLDYARRQASRSIVVTVPDGERCQAVSRQASTCDHIRRVMVCICACSCTC